MCFVCCFVMDDESPNSLRHRRRIRLRFVLSLRELLSCLSTWTVNILNTDKERFVNSRVSTIAAAKEKT